jgi:hypothetical protein
MAVKCEYMALRLGSVRYIMPLLVFAPLIDADTAAFDLAGPAIQVRVTRGGQTLPISEVPNLAPGDRLWLRPELSEAGSVHYLLIAVFLRGATNPPPENWFIKAETWNKQVQQQGIVVPVPEGAGQALLFLAPETAGDFRTLRSAVQGKPGVFVRVSQDLNQASLDRTRLDKYLKAVKETSDNDPADLHQRSIVLARSLGIKLDEQCFDKPTEQQAPCLMRNLDQLVLDDGHAASMVAALTSGAASDLIGALSTLPLARGGYYSPYVGAFVDVARILDNLRTAEYQYIPALALPKQENLELKLNNPPSLHKPKSVLVTSLPPVEPAKFPPLRPVEPKEVFCLQRSSLVLPVQGAPLVFSTELGHDFTLHLQSNSGEGIDLPAKVNAIGGGFVVDTRSLDADNLDPAISGTIHGYWGFQAFDGPGFHLRSAHAASWTVADRRALIVGREDTLHLESDGAACVARVIARDEQGKEIKTVWKLVKPEVLELTVPMQGEAPGRVTLSVKQYGASEPDEIRLQAYSEAAHLDRFAIRVGARQGVLTGTRLDEVASLELDGVHFLPAGFSRAGTKDQLRLSAPETAATPALPADDKDDKLVAHVALKDGRDMDAQATVEPPRPRVFLIGKSVQPGKASDAAAIRLANPDELPQDAQLSFFVKTEVPASFPRAEKIEVANADESVHVLLSVAEGNLILQDAHTVLAVLDPLKDFGPSSFGPLRFRPVDADGTEGDWQSLASLVRLPSLKDVHCPDAADKPCTLSGSKLFLIESVAADPQFTHPVLVPDGFAGKTLSVPRPTGTLLYLKLRDDPSVVDTAVLPVLPEQPL